MKNCKRGSICRNCEIHGDKCDHSVLSNMCPEYMKALEREKARISNLNLNIVQCNCQRAYAVMCDLGETMCERRVSVALLQEPYVRDRRVCGLPVSMDVIVDEGETECGIKTAVVVNDPKLELMYVREYTNEYDVCVWLKGNFGELYVVSMYCQFSREIEPSFVYMDRVRECTKRKRVLIGMDANAISPLWYSKGGGRSRDSELRGGILEEWIITNDMIE